MHKKISKKCSSSHRVNRKKEEEQARKREREEGTSKSNKNESVLGILIFQKEEKNKPKDYVLHVNRKIVESTAENRGVNGSAKPSASRVMIPSPHFNQNECPTLIIRSKRLMITLTNH